MRSDTKRTKPIIYLDGGALERLSKKDTQTAITKSKRFDHIQKTSGMLTHRNKLNPTRYWIPAVIHSVVTFFDKTQTVRTAREGPEKADPILLMDSMTVSEIPKSKANPVIQTPPPTVVSLLMNSKRSLFFKRVMVLTAQKSYDRPW